MHTLLREEELIQAAVVAVEEICHCGISTNHFAGGAFLCFQKSSSRAVTYRTKLLLAIQNVTKYIASWVSTSPSIPIGGVLLQVDGACPFPINSFSDPECRAVTEGMTTAGISMLITTVGEQSNELAISIEHAVGVVLVVLVLLFIVTTIPTVFFWKKMKSKKHDQHM